MISKPSLHLQTSLGGIGSRRDRVPLGFIARKLRLKFRFPKAVCRRWVQPTHFCRSIRRGLKVCFQESAAFSAPAVRWCQDRKSKIWCGAL